MAEICSRCLSQQQFHMLELFSGIGGMHLAFEASGLPQLISKVNVTAIDINTNANLVYSANFPGNKLMARNITALKAEELDKHPIDLLTMSPPCQPFTRLGLKKDLEDFRSDAFFHLMTNILPVMTNKPKTILLENVKGFEGSQARNLMMETLSECGYTTQELLLSPNQLGVPNTRLRYYLLGKLRNGLGIESFCFPQSEDIMTSLPSLNEPHRICSKCHQTLLRDYHDYETKEIDAIKSYLEIDFQAKEEKLLEEFGVPEKIVEKYLAAMDIVSYRSYKSCCFTRSYGSLVTGTGSLLNCDWSDDPLVKSLERRDTLKLRYFTPREVANLMSFPDHFHFPPVISNKQRYKLLGNSINVKVVSILMELLLAEPVP